MRKMILLPLAGLALAASPAQAQDIGSILGAVLGGGGYSQPSYGYQQSDPYQDYSYQPAYGYQQSYGYQPAYGYQQSYGYQPRYAYSYRQPRYSSYGYRRYSYPRYRYSAYRHHHVRHHNRTYAYGYAHHHRWE